MRSACSKHFAASAFSGASDCTCCSSGYEGKDGEVRGFECPQGTFGVVAGAGCQGNARVIFKSNRGQTVQREPIKIHKV